MNLSRRGFFAGVAALGAAALGLVPKLPAGMTGITINKSKHVSWEFSTRDLTISIEEYSDRYIRPAMEEMATENNLVMSELVNRGYDKENSYR